MCDAGPGTSQEIVPKHLFDGSLASGGADMNVSLV
jgi:hypothetical protein